MDDSYYDLLVEVFGEEEGKLEYARLKNEASLSSAARDTVDTPEIITSEDDPTIEDKGEAEEYQYQFPADYGLLKILPSRYTEFDEGSLLREIEHFSKGKDELTDKIFDYDIVRDRLIFANVALNLQGKIPPAYRNMRRPPPKISGVDYSSDDINLSNDRQVIDLHWIHCKRMQVSRVEGFAKLFESELFDWGLASEFVSIVGGANRKSELLGLCEFDELQLAAIRSKGIVSRWKTINNAVKRETSKLRNYVRTPVCRLPHEIRNCFENIYKALLIGRNSSADAAKAFRFMSGSDLPKKQMERYAELVGKAGVTLS